MKHANGVRRSIVLVLVMVMSVFALGANRRADQPIYTTEGQTNTAAIDSLESNDAIFESTMMLLKQLGDVQALKETLKVMAVQWSTNKEGNIAYTEDQTQRAIEIDDRTPLDLETSLYLIHYCDTYAVDPALVLSIIEVESKFDPLAVGSSKDRGLMQIIPSTERWLAKHYGQELGLEYNPNQIFEPEYNLGLAIRYIAHMLDRYDGNVHRALSEYNKGDKKLAQYYATYSTYQTGYSKSILKRVDQYAFEDTK